ncbi:MAG: hypothetical protein ACI8RZ_002317 [Myxococcota bacterium]|jgi:hypothetical protein
MFDVISQADLIAASSRLTLRRAMADAALLPRSIDRGLDALILTWPDAVCVFPVGAGLSDSRCTCPARRLCRHRVRSVLYLARDPTEDALGGWSPADFPRAIIAAAAGKTLLRQAEEALHDGIVVRTESDTAAVIPALGVRVRFLPRQSLGSALCSCGRRELCIHRVLAALHFQPPAHRPVRPPAPDEAALTARIRSAVTELLMLGLDGTPPEAGEGLSALSQRIATALPAPADDLTRLSRLLADYHSRSARFSARGWLMTAARLLARLIALSDTDRTIASEHLRGRGRRTRLSATNLDLLGLGGEGFTGPGGSVVKCWFVLEQTGDVVYGTVGRGTFEGDPPSAASLWWQPMWGDESPGQLAHARLRLPSARLSPDGSLGGAVGPVQHRPIPVTPADLPASLRADGVDALKAMWRALPPPLLRAPGQTSLPAVITLAAPPGPAFFHPTTQRLLLPTTLADGTGLTLEVRYGPATKRLIAVLERISAWEAPPEHLLVRFWPTASGLVAAPISAWLTGRDGPISLGLGDTPLSRGAPADPQRPLPPRPPQPAPLRTLRDLTGLLERMAITGIQRTTHEDDLRRAAASLNALGLPTAAQALAAFAAAPSAEGFVGLLGWATAVEEALLLR